MTATSDLPPTVTEETGEAPASGVRAAIGRHPVAAFGLLAYGLSWAWWLPIALRHQVITRGSAWPTHFPGLIGPLIAAVAVTAITAGRTGVGDLVSRMFRWRIGWKGWALALGTPLAMLAISLPFEKHLSWSSFGTFNGLPRGTALVWLALVFVNGLGEETGWRGFVLPHLRERHGLVDSSLRLAVLWGFWHIPLFAIVETFRGFTVGSLIGFAIGLASGSLVLAWLYERTGASILAVAVWHGTYNLAAAAGNDAPVRSAIVTTVVIAWAVFIAIHAHRHGDPPSGGTRPVSSRRNRGRYVEATHNPPGPSPLTRGNVASITALPR